MTLTKNGKRSFYRFEKNGRYGRIKPWGNGTFGTSFRHAGKTYRNNFATFEAAYDYLDREFSKLDNSVSDSIALNPIRHDVKTYHELEQLLREHTNAATLREAVDYYIAHSKSKPFQPLTVSKCCAEFLADHQVSPPQMKTLRKHLGHFERSFGSKKINEISSKEITNWLRNCCSPNGERWSATTQKKVRGSLVTMSIHARDTLHAISSGKTSFQMSKFDRLPDQKPVEIYTPTQLGALLLKAIDHDIDLIPALVVGGLLGLRPDEFHAETAREKGAANKLGRRPLCWEAFDWNDLRLYVHGQKVRTAATRDIPISPAAQAWLAPFKEQTGEIWRRTKAYDRRMTLLFEKAQVTKLYDAFRHSYASYRLRHLKHDYATLAAEMGNSREEILKSYRRGVTDAEADAWFAVAPPVGYAEKIKAALKSAESAYKSEPV